MEEFKMDKLITAILFIGIPMALTQLIYRIIDHKGNKTAKLAERFPVLVKRKFLVQIGGAMAFGAPRTEQYGELCFTDRAGKQLPLGTYYRFTR